MHGVGWKSVGSGQEWTIYLKFSQIQGRYKFAGAGQEQTKNQPRQDF